jgi:hypothetical protein
LRRRLWQRLRRDGRQFDRRGFADLDRDGDDRRLGDRRGFFRIGVYPVAGQAGDLRRAGVCPEGRADGSVRRRV